MSTNYYVVQAQRDLATAQNNELRAILNYRKALVELERLQQTTLQSLAPRSRRPVIAAVGHSDTTATAMKRASIIVPSSIVAAIGAGAGAYYYKRGGTEMSVNTSPVTRGDVVDTVGATGTLQAVTTVQVGSQVSGNISSLGADFNSIVKKGQVIARLDPSLFEAQVQQARANLSRRGRT